MADLATVYALQTIARKAESIHRQNLRTGGRPGGVVLLVPIVVWCMAELPTHAAMPTIVYTLASDGTRVACCGHDGDWGCAIAQGHEFEVKGAAV